VIFTCAGKTLRADEADYFREADPFGFILFADNIESGPQVRDLVAALRDCIERPDAPVLIDQEGGRVARFGPPEWRAAPPARVFGELAARDLEAASRAARLNARLMATELHEMGINVDCAPVLDLSIPGAHDVIGDRSYGGDPDLVATLGRAVAEGLLAGGVMPMIKHMPGHGRAMADSHKELPSVDLPLSELQATDFAPFRALADMPLAMTAHILFPQLDPALPATTSPRIVREILRGDIGYEGLIVSDDVTMGALSGDNATRARATREAGCDIVLHCYAELDGMREIAKGAGLMDEESSRRWARGLAMLPGAPDSIDKPALEAELAALLEA